MRKKELLEWPPCVPPDFNGIKAKRKNRTGRITHALTAQIVMSEGEDILEIDAWDDNFGLILRYFADRETGIFKVLLTETGEWKKLALDNAISVALGGKPDAKTSVYGMEWYTKDITWDYASEEDRKRVTGYLGCSVNWWETEQERKRWLRSEDLKRERIGAMMDREVPAPPDDFEEWVRKTAFDREYLFLKENRKYVMCTCSACAKSFIRKKGPKELKGKQICPKCGSEVTVTKEEEKTSSWEVVYLLQPCLHTEGRWVERKISVRRNWDRKGSTLILQEEIRILIPKGERWGECYYAMYDSNHGIYFWDHNTPSYRCGKGYLYPGTLKQLADRCWDNDLKHAGLEILAGKNLQVNVNNVIIYEDPILEYLIKNGLTTIAVESINRGLRNDRSLLNTKGKDAREVLRLDDDRIRRLRQMKGGHISLGWLQYERTMGMKISQENLLYLEKHGVRKANTDVWRCLASVRSPERFANYLKKQAKLLHMGPIAVASEWADYLNMAEKQKLNLKADIFIRPKNLKAAHNECVWNGQQEEMKKRRREVLKKFPDTEKILKSIRDKYSYTEPDYSIVVPKGILEIIHEGRALGHCIDTTDRYFERIQTRVSFLVFLRRTQEADTPWYTLEIEPGGTIRQERTTGNTQDRKDKEAYMPFIRRWQQEIRNRMSEDDKRLASMSEQARIREYKELREKKETVWRGPMAGKLLADVLEADLIEAVNM